MHWLYFLNFLIIWSYYNSKVLGMRQEIAHRSVTTSQPQVRLTPIYDNTTIYCTNSRINLSFAVFYRIFTTQSISVKIPSSDLH